MAAPRKTELITPRKNEYLADGVSFSNHGVPKENNEEFNATITPRNFHSAQPIPVLLTSNMEEGVSWTNNNRAPMAADNDAKFVATITPRKNEYHDEFVTGITPRKHKTHEDAKSTLKGNTPLLEDNIGL